MPTIASERKNLKHPQPLGKTVRVLTQSELIAAMAAHNREVCRTKESAVAFLQRAGIVGDDGQLAQMYRS